LSGTFQHKIQLQNRIIVWVSGYLDTIIKWLDIGYIKVILVLLVNILIALY